MEPEQTEKKYDARTETMMDGTLIQYVLISPTGVRVFRKGGGFIDIKPSDPRNQFAVTFSTKD
jgi:hypothetical protein